MSRSSIGTSRRGRNTTPPAGAARRCRPRCTARPLQRRPHDHGRRPPAGSGSARGGSGTRGRCRALTGPGDHRDVEVVDEDQREAGDRNRGVRARRAELGRRPVSERLERPCRRQASPSRRTRGWPASTSAAGRSRAASARAPRTRAPRPAGPISTTPRSAATKVASSDVGVAQVRGADVRVEAEQQQDDQHRLWSHCGGGGQEKRTPARGPQAPRRPAPARAGGAPRPAWEGCRGDVAATRRWSLRDASHGQL